MLIKKKEKKEKRKRKENRVCVFGHPAKIMYTLRFHGTFNCLLANGISWSLDLHMEGVDEVTLQLGYQAGWWWVSINYGNHL